MRLVSDPKVARALRADATLQGVHLIALSGYAQAEDVTRARAAGFERHLAKPPSLDKLAALLTELAQGDAGSSRRLAKHKYRAD